MTSSAYERDAPNKLLSIALNHPVLMMLALYLLAYLFKVLDTIVFRFDELVGEAIITKVLGFLLVLFYTVLNMLFIRTAARLQGGFEFGLFLAIWLPGYLLLIPIFGWLAKSWQMPHVKPWGAFDGEQVYT